MSSNTHFIVEVMRINGSFFESTQSGNPEIRNVKLPPTELDTWLNEQGSYIRPTKLRNQRVQARLRLIYHFWTASEDETQPKALPFSLESWKKVCSALKLPTCLSRVIADRKQVAPMTIANTHLPGSSIGQSMCQHALQHV